jgi:mono/diheme cytochrome c family protein
MAHIGLLVLGLAGTVLFWRDSRNRPAIKPAIWIPVAVTGLAAFMGQAPLGRAATGVDFASYDARVSWYTWPMHASLNLFSKISPTLGWIGSGVVPGILMAVLVLAPWLARRSSERVVTRVLLGFGVYFLVAIVTVGGGGVAPLTGNRDPVAGDGSGGLSPVGSADPVLVSKGRDLFNSVSCSGCHGIDGKKPVAGPNLSGVAGRRGGDPDWYMRFIKNPAATKGSSTMPPFPKLKNDELRALAEFLIHN